MYRKKGIRHYLEIYLISLFLGLNILIFGNFFEFNSPCANSKTCKSDLSISIDNNAIGIFQGHKVIPPKVDLSMINAQNSVLGARITNEKKHIYVDLSTQTLYAYEGEKKIMQMLISSGKWNRTPVGNYNVWQKLPVTRMAGGQGDDAYDLPNVQWVMYFHNDFGFHTAYWHNNFGHPMSHGCINMRLVDARELYVWAEGPTSNQKGTAVSICNKFKESGICMQDNV
jgi:lipoprotein-anchoring transpeptidase ErfK/SrfK